MYILIIHNYLNKISDKNKETKSINKQTKTKQTKT